MIKSKEHKQPKTLKPLLIIYFFLFSFFFCSIGHAMQENLIESPQLQKLSLRNKAEDKCVSSNDLIATPKEKKWNQHWFVQNVIAEIPLIEVFVHDYSAHECMKKFGKSTAMLIGGSLGMMLFTSEDDSRGVKLGENIAGMAIGMGIAGISYNLVLSASDILYHKFQEFNWGITQEPNKLLMKGYQNSSDI
ncbi:MAG: hypothetical protein K2Q34_01450 [Alphaproteobacteria bacterium]|nr:hypothetical protein [Alphaproteobacteria bacterium]